MQLISGLFIKSFDISSLTWSCVYKAEIFKRVTFNVKISPELAKEKESTITVHNIISEFIPTVAYFSRNTLLHSFDEGVTQKRLFEASPIMSPQDLGNSLQKINRI